MPLTAEQIYNEAVQLPNETKIFLVEKLMENIDIDRDTETLQIREAKKRRDERVQSFLDDAKSLNINI
ncbi:MAG: hypothetical protein GY749_18140 [Desulfobacteraceae bacterium]|nr:hypothetical protein [Desulfobacteraceae bacterium]